jgi:hypothetical protein
LALKLLSMRSSTTAILAATLVLAGCVASAGIASAEPPPPAPEPRTTIDNDGTYSVGTDIVPGTYSSAGPVAGGTCYWKRVGGPAGSDIVDNAMTKKPQVVQIDPGDTVFKTTGCQPWQKTDAVSAPAGTPPLIAQFQLRHYLDILNGNVGQFGGERLPGP